MGLDLGAFEVGRGKGGRGGSFFFHSGGEGGGGWGGWRGLVLALEGKGGLSCGFTFP